MNGENEESESVYQKQYEKQVAELQKARALELQRRHLLKKILEPEAYERLANIRSANPALYAQLANLLLYLYQNGQLKEKISETQLREFISRLLSKRRETKIIRK